MKVLCALQLKICVIKMYIIFSEIGDILQQITYQLGTEFKFKPRQQECFIPDS
jgi:hypothetical protein